MWTTLAVCTALGATAADAPPLTFSDVHSTHGLLGPRRKSDRLLPGDSLFVHFNIEGIKPDKDGKARYSLALEVLDNQGKMKFKQHPRELAADNSLGGERVPAFAKVHVGLQEQPGEYLLRITVKDKPSGRSGSFDHRFTVLPKAFGVVRPMLTFDAEGRFPAVLLSGDGQSVWVHFAAVGFARDKDGQPNLRFEVRVLDQDGRPTLPRPAISTISKDVPSDFVALPMSFPLSLNRPGRFTLELSAADQIAHKSDKLSIPLTVRSLAELRKAE